MKKVVVIGGGFAGAYVANALQKEFAVTLIDTKDYFEFTPSVLRALVDPRVVKHIQVNHTHYLTKGTFIQGSVTDITKKEVFISTKKIPFDYAVVTSGSFYSLPIKESNIVLVSRAEHLREYHYKLEHVKKILIIGGGLVGVELAAELCTHYPEKEVTIVHANKDLIERNDPKSRKYAKKFLQKHNVKLIFNERATEQKKNTFVTDKGRILKADLVIPCTGIKPNYSLLEKHFSNSITDNHGIAVNSYLQMKGSETIFAGGDITHISEEKTAQTAEMHAAYIVKNIRNLEHGKPLQKYKAVKRPMVISLGKWDGLLEYQGIVVAGLLPVLGKKFVEWKTMLRYWI